MPPRTETLRPSRRDMHEDAGVGTGRLPDHRSAVALDDRLGTELQIGESVEIASDGGRYALLPNVRPAEATSSPS